MTMPFQLGDLSVKDLVSDWFSLRLLLEKLILYHNEISLLLINGSQL